MNKISPDEPAFPVVADNKYDTHLIMELQHPGLSIRAQIAAMAMQGLLASGDFTDTAEQALAELAVRQGDELIEQLNK